MSLCHSLRVWLWSYHWTPVSHLQTGNVTPFTPSWPSCSNEPAALHLLLKAQMLVRSPCLPVTQAITDEMRESFYQNDRIQSNKYQKASSIKFLAPAWNHAILLSETGLPYENNKSYILMRVLFFFHHLLIDFLCFATEHHTKCWALSSGCS